MKELYLIRHAKSDWSIDGLADIDRALNSRGYNDAHAVGKYLRSNGIFPQTMITSPAIRALSTALIISQEISFPKQKIFIEPKLYETGLKEHLAVIRAVKKETSSVFLFGHNPVLSELCNYLSAGNSEMPTCAIARFTILDDNWNKLSNDKAEFIEMITPKTIPLT